MSDIKLLPCPFCGGEAEVFTSDEIGYLGNDGYTVKCGSCICGTGHYKDRQRAIEMWNTRKPMERIVEKLEEKADEAHDGYNPVIAQTFRRAIEIVKEGGKHEGR